MQKDSVDLNVDGKLGQEWQARLFASQSRMRGHVGQQGILVKKEIFDDAAVTLLHCLLEGRVSPSVLYTYIHLFGF